MKKDWEMNTLSNAELIAPCGMNCGICFAYVREKNACLGCRIEYSPKPVSRANCKIKNCTLLGTSDFDFCFDCGEYPCQRLKHLDKRYRTKYKMSMIENQDNIKRLGIDQFLENERERWICPVCAGVICVHKGLCLNCEKARLLTKNSKPVD